MSIRLVRGFNKITNFFSPEHEFYQNYNFWNLETGESEILTQNACVVFERTELPLIYYTPTTEICVPCFEDACWEESQKNLKRISKE